MSMSEEVPTSPPGRVAGIDYGTSRIGIAISDSGRTIASPHSVFECSDKSRDESFFRDLAVSESVGQFVVGLPVHLSGEESEKSLEARQFGKWLGDVTGVPGVYFDERFTTQQADELMAGKNLTRKQRSARLRSRRPATHR